MPQFKITKVDKEHEVPAPRRTRRRSMRTYPKGVLKGGEAAIVGVKDPAKPPPLRTSAKGTLTILTPSGMRKRRETIKSKVRSLSDSEVRDALRKNKMTLNSKTPSHIAREILESGTEAGMIVLK